jgi:hypothetical protein
VSNFIVTEPPVQFKIGETIVARRVRDTITGFDKLAPDGTRTSIPGHMTDVEPEDKRMKMPLTIDGVQLWYGWTRR